MKINTWVSSVSINTVAVGYGANIFVLSANFLPARLLYLLDQQVYDIQGPDHSCLVNL